MIANYHTHTPRCMHAVGSEREYIEYAIASGLKILGFSDHTPQPYRYGYVSNVKMRPEELEDYVTTVLKLKEEYRQDIEILLGLEVEYYPMYFEELLKMTGAYPIDYFLLGQHFLGNEHYEPYNGNPTAEPDRLFRYVAQCIEALETGCFSYFAHPDLLYFTGDSVLYETEMRKLCVRSRELSIPLEINLQGLWDGRNYPDLRFWRMAAEEGCTAILGSDAHSPERVYHYGAIKKAEALVKDLGLTLLDTLPLVNPFH